MRVLILNQYALPPGAGGITRHADLGRRLTDRGHSVSIIAADLDYLSRQAAGRPGDELIDGIRFRWLDCGTYTANDSRRVRSMVTYAWRAVIAGVRMRPRPDVVVGSSPQLLAGLSGLVIARLLRRPFVFEVRDPWPSALVDLGAVRAGSLSHRVLTFLERLLYRRADRILTVMEHLDIRVAEVGADPARCVHIPNASTIPPPVAPMPPSLAQAMDAEALEGRLIVTYVGAHGVSNGLTDVADALDRLRHLYPREYERLAMFFIGGGPERPALEARVKGAGHDHVHFHDAIPKASALGALARSDFVLVHFARADFKRFGMSANKLFDAMAVGRPALVATPLEDTPVDTVACGFRYEPGSPEALAETIAKALSLSPHQRTAMGERGYAEARRRYDLEVTGRQFEELLATVVNERRS